MTTISIVYFHIDWIVHPLFVGVDVWHINVWVYQIPRLFQLPNFLVNINE